MKKTMLILAVGSVAFTACNKEPELSFTADKTTAEVGEIITFTNTTEKGKNFVWDFGDGTNSTGYNATTVYGRSGTYTVTLSSTSNKGNKHATLTQTITITNTKADFSWLSDAEREIMTKLLDTKWKVSTGSEVYTPCDATMGTASTLSVTADGLKYELHILANGNMIVYDADKNRGTTSFNLVSANLAEVWGWSFPARYSGGSFDTNIFFSGLYDLTVTDSKITFKRTEKDNGSSSSCKDTEVQTLEFTKM